MYNADFFKRYLEMKCSKIIASKVKLAQSVQDRTKTRSNAPSSSRTNLYPSSDIVYTFTKLSFYSLLESNGLLFRNLNSIHVKIHPEDTSMFNHRNDLNCAC